LTFGLRKHVIFLCFLDDIKLFKNIFLQRLIFDVDIKISDISNI